MTAPRPFRATAAVVALLSLLAGGCGHPQRVRQIGTMGVNGEVGPIILRAVYIEAPATDRYPAGADPVVRLTLINQAQRPDVLTLVSSRDARAVEMYWDRDCDGTAERVPRLPLRPVEFASASSEPRVALPFQPYHLRLIDPHRDVLAGTTVPLVFTFDKAGRVQLDAHVQSSNATRPGASRRCTPEPTATP